MPQDFIPQDKFGPEYLLKVYDPKIGMEGFLVIDNTVLGPAKGGIRMTPNVTLEEVWRLARTMTWKTALAELAFGGGKAGIVWKGGSPELKKKYVESFARAIKFLTPQKYIAGPDINTGDKEMEWFARAAGKWNSATGKPENLCLEIFGKPGEKKCGIPHEFGSTGYGVAIATKMAISAAGLNLGNTSVAIHGFGNVGGFTFKYLTGMGAKVVGLADATATIYNKEGLDKSIIETLSHERKTLDHYPDGKRISSEEFWGLPVDVIIPASITDVINDNNKHFLQAKIIVEAANIPMTEKVEKELFGKGILIIPDFVANAGGVISSYAEYRGYHLKKMLELVERKITKNIGLVLKESLNKDMEPRNVALMLAQKRVEKKMHN